jgi:hypothetical protein
MAKWIAARQLQDTDVLEFQGITEHGSFVDGIPIDKLTRHADGRVEIDVTYIDGSYRHKTFASYEQVQIR